MSPVQIGPQGRARGWLLSPRSCGCTRPIQAKDKPFTAYDMKYLIKPLELQQSIGNFDLRLVDCRFVLLDPDAGRASYREGHIPGAVFADLDRDLAGPVRSDSGRHPLPDVDRISDTFSNLGIGSSTSVIVYDDSSGALAARAWWLLRWLGHDDVRVLDGGLAAWVAEGGALEAGQVSVQPRVFEARPRDHLVMMTDEIANAGDAIDELRLVDARDEARFSGQAEPIDPVAGHIPGSLNLPFAVNLDADGRWKSPEELEMNLESVLGPDRHRPWSVMCGSGVTACHLVIAGLLAGYCEPRVYVGSWSEWIADPGRPIATGPSR